MGDAKGSPMVFSTSWVAVVACLTAFVAASFGSVAFGAVGPSPWDDPVAPPSIETMFNDPLFIGSQVEARRLEEQREFELLLPDAIAERRESRTEFSEMSDAAAP